MKIWVNCFDFISSTPLLILLLALSLNLFLVFAPGMARADETNLTVDGKLYLGPEKIYKFVSPVNIELSSVGPREELFESSTGAQSEMVGFPRSIVEMDTVEQVSRKLTWLRANDGSLVSNLRFSSENAKMLRVALNINEELPDDIEIRFFDLKKVDGDTSKSIFNVSGAEINKTIKVNMAAAKGVEGVNTYWSPLVAGDEIGVQVVLPKHLKPESIRVTFPSLSHIPLSNGQNEIQADGDAKSCQTDIACVVEPTRVRASAVAAMYSTTGRGNTFYCTGTVIRDTVDETDIPYFVTANHCLSNQIQASNLVTRWYYQSDECDSATRNNRDQYLYGGADLLWTRDASFGRESTSNHDFTLLRLRRQPPPGVFFAGWTMGISPTLNYAISHPRGDRKKIAEGKSTMKTSYNCYQIGNRSFRCDENAKGNFYKMDFTNGGTEPGSSGSGVFLMNGLLVGTLYGGTGECAGSSSYYSKFRSAYNVGKLGRWLNPPKLK